jgi:hypothetical protein
MTSESKPTYKCKYCDKAFAKETTLIAHQCEPKRRWQQEKETGVQWGLRAYLRFYEYAQGGSKQKSYADFVSSPYYTAFVKYGRHQVALRNVNFNSYTDWLLKNNKKLDYWTQDKLYVDWLNDYVRKEAPQDALERALTEMQDYADTHTDLKNGFRDYFRYGNANRICHHITTCRISPWVVYNCDSGVEFLDQLDETQVAMILPWIDPDYWQTKFKDYPADVAWCREVLGVAGL